MNNSGSNSGAGNAKGNRTTPHNTVPKQKVIVENLGGVDRPFLICVLLLLCMGTVMVFSSSYPYARAHFDDSYYFAKRHVLFVFAGLGVMWLVVKLVSYRLLRKWNYLIMGVGLALLVVVLFVGDDTKGAVRWIQVGPITIQPSEIMKFAMVLFFADYADKFSEKMSLPDDLLGNWKWLAATVAMLIAAAGAFFLIPDKWARIIFALIFAGISLWCALHIDFKHDLPGIYYGILPYLCLLFVVAVLLALQPHISGLIIIAAIVFLMMVIGGTKVGYLLTGLIGGGAALLVLALSMGHSSTRLKVWRDPFQFLTGEQKGWQPVQSLYAIGSGGYTGVGFGNSRQKHLYLPEPQNDYIFSIWCEEMGFIGAVVLICVFVFFIYRGILIGLRAPDRFSSMLVIGIIMHVGLQVILNIAVVTNTLPSTGISLPFFSYGGTALMILLAEMGVVLSVSRRSRVEKT